MDTISTLLRKLIDHYGIRSFSELASIIDYNSRTMQRYVKGNSVPKIDFYQKIKKAFPDLDIKAFMDGHFKPGLNEIELNDPKNDYSITAKETDIDYRKKYFDLLERYTICLEEKLILNQTLLSHERLIATKGMK